MHNHYNAYRRALAWIGFAVIYLALPLILAAVLYNFSRLNSTTYNAPAQAQDDRTEPFYQQTALTPRTI